MANAGRYINWQIETDRCSGQCWLRSRIDAGYSLIARNDSNRMAFSGKLAASPIKADSSQPALSGERLPRLKNPRSQRQTSCISSSLPSSSSCSAIVFNFFSNVLTVTSSLLKIRFIAASPIRALPFASSVITTCTSPAKFSFKIMHLNHIKNL